jgi:hypothetical protein
MTDFEPHYDHPQRLIRIVRNRMLHSRRQIGEVMLAQPLNLIFVMQYPSALDHKIDLLLSVVGHSLAIPVSIQRNLAEASHGLEGSIVLITLAKHRPVVASLRGEIGFRLH